eukprot:4721281-Amphidinium_carterae.1
MHGNTHRALDVVVVPQVCALLFHNDNMSNCRCGAHRQTLNIASVGRRVTIRMGSGGNVWAKPPSTQRIGCSAFEDLLRVAFWLRFASAGQEEC